MIPDRAVRLAVTGMPYPTSLSRTELIQQGYVFEPSEMMTYRIPRTVGYYVKYEPAPSYPHARSLAEAYRQAYYSGMERAGFSTLDIQQYYLESYVRGEPKPELERFLGLAEGARVTHVGLGPSGYHIRYEMPAPSWKETSVSGAALKGELEPGPVSVLRAIGLQVQAEGLRQWYKEQEWWLHPFGTKEASRKFSAAIIAVPESTYKTAKGLAGFGWEPMPPTFMGAMVSPTERKEFQELGPAYWVGSLYASGLEAIAVGKAADVAYKGIKAVAPQAVKEAAYSAKEAVRFSRFAKALYETKLWTQTHYPTQPFWKAYWAVQRATTKHLAIGEITELSPKAFPRVGLKELELAELSWQIRMAPKMGGVWIRQFPALTKGLQKYGLETIVRGGIITQVFRPFREEELVRGVLPYYAPREATFTPLVSQAQVTRMGIHPYFPTMAPTMTRATGKIATALIGTTILTVPKPFQIPKPKRIEKEAIIPILKPWIPTFTWERERLKPQELLRLEPMQKQRQTLIYIPKVAVTPSTILKEAQVTIQKQRQATIQTLGFPASPKLTKLDIPFPTYHMGGGESGLGSVNRAFAKWFKKVHLVKTPEQMLETFFGKPRRKRKPKERS